LYQPATLRMSKITQRQRFETRLRRLSAATRRVREEFIERIAGTTCPACQSARVVPGVPQSPEVQPYRCAACHAEWAESTKYLEIAECY
jgi:DNA-directed RNA polymerase subunit RPC12/RpoP